jgi:hypothetical protein
MVKFFLVVWAVSAGTHAPVRLDLQEVPTAQVCLDGVADALSRLPSFLAEHPGIEHGQVVCEVWPVPGTDL